MRKIYLLALLLLSGIIATSQSSGKYNSAVNSNGNKTTYSSHSSSHSSSQSSSHTTTYKSEKHASSANNNDWSGSSHHSSSQGSDKSFNRIEKAEKTTHCVKTDHSDTPLKPENNEQGGLKNIRDAELYVDKGNNTHGSSQPSTPVYHEQNNSQVLKNDSISYGLSAEKTTLNANGIRPNNVIITCDDMMTKKYTWNGILSQYEIYDLSQLKRCENPFDKNDLWIVTCSEFERSSDERKKHILSYPEFYNIQALLTCDSYLDFIKPSTPEAEK
jgi:hypothetical protein